MLDTAITRSGGVDGLESRDEVRSAVERYHDALNRRDIDAAVAAFTDDGVIDCTPPPDGERYEGAAGIRALFRQLFDSEGERTFDTGPAPGDQPPGPRLDQLLRGVLPLHVVLPGRAHR